MPDAIIIDEGAPTTIIVQPTTEEITVSEVGVQGPAGGEAAPPYVHTQGMPDDRWTVVHNLGYRPSSIRVTDSANDEIDDFWIENETINGFDLVFSAEFSGVARIK